MDSRKKACPNEKCETYKSKKYNSSENYCPKCGTQLVFVCKSINCYKPIEDVGPKHIFCEECMAKRKDTKDAVINGAKKTAKAIGSAAGGAVLVFAKKETRDVVKKVLNQAKDIIIKK